MTHTHTHTHTVGLFWKRGRPWQHKTVTSDRHSCPRRDSKPQSQQANASRPTP